MSLITAVVGSKVAIALIALGTITVGGSAAAAYTGSLPPGLQNDAHSLLGAPAAEPTDTATGTPTAEPTDDPTETATPDPSATAPVGPDATGPAAHGLCTAFQHGGLAPTSVAYASLAKASGGADGITAYCAVVLTPKPAAGHGPAKDATPTPEPTSEAPESPAQPNGSADHSGHGAPAAPGGSGHSGGSHGRP